MDPVVGIIVARIEARTEEISRRLVERYTQEVLDYRALSQATLGGDIAATAMRNVEELLLDLGRGTQIEGERLEPLRRSGARRVHQGVSFGDLLQAYRLWGQVVWEQLLAAISPDVPEEREAALWMAGRIMRHVDTVSHAVAQAYLDEAAGVWRDREVVRRDLLETLIAGRAMTEPARRQAAELKLELAESHLVLLARPRRAPVADGRETLRAALERAKALLVPAHGSLLVGLREEEIVAIYPSLELGDVATARAQAERLAEASDGWFVGIGRCHAALSGIASSYVEAREALELALASDEPRHVVAFGDVLIDRILGTSHHCEALLEETVRPLRAYDEARNAELLKTLATYFESGFNLTRSAATLHVNPNTVVYRLRRIHTLTGRDPGDPDDLLLLMLGLKLHGLGRSAPVHDERP